MSQSALVEFFDVWALGTVILKWIAGKSVHSIAHAHELTLTLQGKVAAGHHTHHHPSKEGGRGLVRRRDIRRDAAKEEEGTGGQRDGDSD